MKRIEMQRKFKHKDGYTRIIMSEIPTGKISIRLSYCYPADREGEYIEYVQSTREATREDANKEYLKSKKQGFTLI